MLSNKKITIIGLGLIGGSIAKALKKYHNATIIYAITRDKNILDLAQKENIITKGFSSIDNPEVLSSDFIFLCTPVKTAIKYLRMLENKVKKECIITDVCSTKKDIIDCINNLDYPPLFVGGHPMTGKEKTGYTESSSELFVSATYILSRSNFTDEETFLKVFNIIKGIGGICVELNAKEQDKATSLISHLPHAVAFTLVNTIKEANDPMLKRLAAGGFKDVTRIASSDAEMWENIFLTNKDSLNNSISSFIKNLKLLQDMINNDSSDELKKFMLDAKNYRDEIN